MAAPPPPFQASQRANLTSTVPTFPSLVPTAGVAFKSAPLRGRHEGATYPCPYETDTALREAIALLVARSVSVHMKNARMLNLRI